MLGIVLYFFVLFLELVFAISISIYLSSLIYSSIMGAPYVPTKKDDLYTILKEARLKKGTTFLELGSGDGRVVKYAVNNFGVQGRGVDINPLLVLISAFTSRYMKNIQFLNQNIYKTNLSSFNVIYVFLMPEMLKKLRQKLETECKKGTFVISHGFKIFGWDHKLKKVLSRKPFPTYYYEV